MGEVPEPVREPNHRPDGQPQRQEPTFQTHPPARPSQLVAC